MYQEPTIAKGFIAFPRSFFSTKLWEDKQQFTPTEALLDIYHLAYYGSKPMQRTINGQTVTVSRGELVTTRSFLRERWHFTEARVRYLLRTLSSAKIITVFSTTKFTKIVVNEGVVSDSNAVCSQVFSQEFSHNKKKSNKEEDNNNPLKSPYKGERPRAQGEAKDEAVSVEETMWAEKADSTATSDKKVDAAVASDKKIDTVVASDEKADAAVASDKKADATVTSDEKPEACLFDVEEAAAPSAPSAPAAPRKAKKAPFVAPTLEQVAEHCRVKGYWLVSPEAFWAYYEANGWRVGRAPMRSWTAALAMWQARELKRTGGSRPQPPSANLFSSAQPSANLFSSAQPYTKPTNLTILTNQTINCHDSKQSFPPLPEPAEAQLLVPAPSSCGGSEDFKLVGNYGCGGNAESYDFVGLPASSSHFARGCAPTAGRYGGSAWSRSRYPEKRDAAFEALQQFRARQAGDIARMDEEEPEF